MITNRATNQHLLIIQIIHIIRTCDCLIVFKMMMRRAKSLRTRVLTYLVSVYMPLNYNVIALRSVVAYSKKNCLGSGSKLWK
jgi:hypothetical protein